ncbi:MAG: hypothetical protein MAG458_01752 [Nitrosopumilus sp.]|nr:hypothetical protein [Nitrosopumilus sp.]
MKSTKNQISILTIILFSILLIIIPSNVYAEEVEVKSFSLDETAIIQITNYSNENIDTIRIWLGGDHNFKSFKTEKGWSGEKTPQGVLVFKSSESMNVEESVKFGIKTDKINSGVNWKALNKNGEQIDTGKVSSQKIPHVTENSIVNQNSGEGIKSESIFRIIPEKPNPGSSFRVVGEGFGAYDEYELYLDEKIIGNFVTNEKGNFITTMKIPEEQKSDRVDFIIKDKKGVERKISVRLGDIENNNNQLQNTRLTINNISDTVYRGNILEFSGTASPNNSITLKITDPNGKIINNKIVEVNNKGVWEIEDPIVIKSDSIFGKYGITVSDGRNKVLKNWNVESDKIIMIKSNQLRFEPGDIMKFNGTALPNIQIEIIIEDPHSKELFSDIVKVDESGFIKFEFQTEQTSMKGTYAVYVNQNENQELIFVGVGEMPTIPIKIEFDKLNYKSSDTANILLTGESSEILSLLIIDPSDKPKGESISITLQPDGKMTHQLDLTDYSTGVYTAVISKGSSQNTKTFTVGLQTGSGEININTTKQGYIPGESILVLGETAKNVLLTISLINEKDEIIKEKEIFSNKEGKISDESLRIPSDASSGVWKINIKSGSNYNTVEIDILKTVEEGMSIVIEEGEKIPSIGKIISIKVSGAQQTVEIEIKSSNGKIIDKLSFPASEQGEINLPWLIPKELEPGTYTVVVNDAHNIIQGTFEIE